MDAGAIFIYFSFVKLILADIFLRLFVFIFIVLIWFFTDYKWVLWALRCVQMRTILQKLFTYRVRVSWRADSGMVIGAKSEIGRPSSKSGWLSLVQMKKEWIYLIFFFHIYISTYPMKGSRATKHKGLQGVGELAAKTLIISGKGKE